MHASVKVLHERCFSTPNLLRHLQLEPLRHVAPVLQHSDVVVVTGIGASEGPARLLASYLAEGRRAVQFIPLSGLLAGDHRPWVKTSGASCLIVFSQALSPNAKIALAARNDFATTLLICGPDVHIDERTMNGDRRPITILRHPPAGETGFLLRVAGPAVASALALVLGTMVLHGEADEGLLAQCAEAIEKRLHDSVPEVDLLQRPPAFLVLGRDGVERNHLLRWTLLEYLNQYDPPSWDLLSFAHGAFQNIFDDTRTLLLLRSSADEALDPVVERLREMLAPTRHTLLEVTSPLPRPWCVLEHLALVQALVLDHVRKHPRDLAEWPGQGRDGAMYTLDKLPAGG